jgi:putative nucleotidyltransferase with HDIG domain
MDILARLDAVTSRFAAAPDAPAVLGALLRAAVDMGAERPRAGLWRADDVAYAMWSLGADGDAAARGTAPASVFAPPPGMPEAAGVIALATPRRRWGILDLSAGTPDADMISALNVLARQAALCLERLELAEPAPAADAPDLLATLERWWDAPDQDALLRMALGDVARLCGAPSASVALLHPHSGSARIVFSEDIEDSTGSLPWRGVSDGRRNGEAVLRVLRSGEPLAFQWNPTSEALKLGLLPSGPSEGSWAAFPLTDAGGVLGALDIHAPEPRRFGAEQTENLARAARLLSRLLSRWAAAARQSETDHRRDALVDLVATLAEQTDPKQIANTLAATMRRTWPDADLTYVMLPQREGGLWSIAALDSPEPNDHRQGWARAGEGFAGWVIQTRTSLCVNAAADDPRRGSLDGGQGIASGVWVPMLRGDTLVGLLAVAATRTERAFHADDEDAVQQIAAQGAVALERARERHGAQEAFWDAIEAISGAIDARDGYTHGHSLNVTEYTVAIARRMGLPAPDIQTLRASALLHDIGKIGIPDHILNKPANLTPDERTVMESHPEVGYEILLRAPSLQALLPGVRYHHERPDGKGYPCGLSGYALPLQARIMAVADAFDAMTSDRVYRKRMTVEKATNILREGRETQWDAECVDHFLALVEARATPRLQLLAAEDSGRQYLPSLGVDVFGS